MVVNISGGVDSAVTAALALEAVGPQHLFLAMMPYGEAGAQGLRNALLLIEALHIPREQSFLLDIKRAVDAIAEQTVAPDRVRLGNIMARVRMIYLFDLAKRLGALVCGTENRIERFPFGSFPFAIARQTMPEIPAIEKQESAARRPDSPGASLPVQEPAPAVGS